MKLTMSLPERPGWIFVIPGFDFIALLLALVMLTGVVARESYVEVKMPPSEFRGDRLGDENPVVVMLQRTARGPVFYVGGERVAEDDLREVVSDEAEKRGTKAVALKIDREATNLERQALINHLAGLKGMRFFEGYRREKLANEGP